MKSAYQWQYKSTENFDSTEFFSKFVPQWINEELPECVEVWPEDTETPWRVPEVSPCATVNTTDSAANKIIFIDCYLWPHAVDCSASRPHAVDYGVCMPHAVDCLCSYFHTSFNWADPLTNSFSIPVLLYALFIPNSTCPSLSFLDKIKIDKYKIIN